MPITTELKVNQILLVWGGMWITGCQSLTIHGRMHCLSLMFEINVFTEKNFTGWKFRSVSANPAERRQTQSK